MKNRLYKRVFGALANDVRLDILIALRSGQKNVSELVAMLQLDQSAISHGLSRLMRDGFVLMTTKGRFRYYRLCSGGFDQLMKIVGQFTGSGWQLPVIPHSAENERLYRMVDLFPHAIMVESDGKIAYLNKAGVKLFGASTLSRLIGREVLSLVVPRYRAIVKQRIKRLHSGAGSNPLLKEEWYTLEGLRFKANVISSRYRLGKRIGAIAIIRSLV